MLRRGLRRVDENDSSWGAVRALEPQRQAHELILTRLYGSEIEALDRDDACSEQLAVRFLVADRQEVDSHPPGAVPNEVAGARPR
jgi:hypothetical protein